MKQKTNGEDKPGRRKCYCCQIRKNSRRCPIDFAEFTFGDRYSRKIYGKGSIQLEMRQKCLYSFKCSSKKTGNISLVFISSSLCTVLAIYHPLNPFKNGLAHLSGSGVIYNFNRTDQYRLQPFFIVYTGNGSQMLSGSFVSWSMFLALTQFRQSAEKSLRCLCKVRKISNIIELYMYEFI